jgi:hypothetical protein
MNPNLLTSVFFGRWIVLGLTTLLGAGCSYWPFGQDVKLGVSVNKVYLSVPDSLTKSPWMETFLWTIKCEAVEGKICEGTSTLLIPSDKTLCRYDYKIIQGPEGNTEQVVQAENDSALKVYIRAVGGPEWKPYKSKIVIQVRAVGIVKDVDEETRKSLNCNPLT